MMIMMMLMMIMIMMMMAMMMTMMRGRREGRRRRRRRITSRQKSNNPSLTGGEKQKIKLRMMEESLPPNVVQLRPWGGIFCTTNGQQFSTKGQSFRRV